MTTAAVKDNKLNEVPSWRKYTLHCLSVLLGIPSRCQLLQRNDIKSGVSLKLVGDVAVPEDFVTHSTRAKHVMIWFRDGGGGGTVEVAG